MLFPSYAFLFAFLPLALAVVWGLPARWRSPTLTVLSYAFYGWWRPDFTLLLLASTAIDFGCARRIDGAPSAVAKRRWLGVSLAVNLGLLGYFKYANFGVENLQAILRAWGLEAPEWVPVVLPVGISFYTFQTLSYTIDVYRGDVRPARRFIDYACYVALFPQLVAGPIVRFRTLAGQLAEWRKSLSGFADGVLFFQLGLAKKVLLADQLAPLVDGSFGWFDEGEIPSLGIAWLGLGAYSLQIYFDFSGYSDMALGLGRMFGFTYPPNFSAPYRAENLSQLWRRWHVSLSTWLRDYVYFPLGGSRKGRARTALHLILTLGLCGLWHGAAWPTVLWGLYHGALLAGERLLGGSPYASWPRPARVACTFMLWTLGLVFARSGDLATTAAFFGALLGSGGFDGWRLVGSDLGLEHAAVLLAAVGICWGAATSQDCIRRAPGWLAPWAALSFVASVAALLHGVTSPFLYFQF